MAEAQRNPFMEQINKNIQVLLATEMKKRVVSDGKGGATIESYIVLDGGKEKVISQAKTSIDKIVAGIADLEKQKAGIIARIDAQIADLEGTRTSILEGLK